LERTPLRGIQTSIEDDGVTVWRIPDAVPNVVAEIGRAPALREK